jgi:hypothetical protein
VRVIRRAYKGGELAVPVGDATARQQAEPMMKEHCAGVAQFFIHHVIEQREVAVDPAYVQSTDIVQTDAGTSTVTQTQTVTAKEWRMRYE